MNTTTIAPKSGKLGKLSSASVDLLNRIRALDADYAQIQKDAAANGITIAADGPQAYLSDLAIVSKKLEQAALSEEAVARTQARVNNTLPMADYEPTTRVGRFFAGIARAVG